MIWLILFIITVIIFALFVSRKYSPVPYFPSNKKDLPLILEAFNLRNNQTIVDMGAGGGLVIFAAAKESYKKKLNTKFIAVEVNPILILILYARKLFQPNGNRVKIIWADMFTKNFKPTIQQSNNLTVFTYISPWFMEEIYKKLKNDLGKFELVSYFYPLPNKKAKKTMQGVNKVFKY